MPLFTVIIPTFRRQQELARALRSVAAQTFVDFEVLVVNDDPATRVNVVEHDHIPVKVLGGSDNIGKIGSLLLGARASKGEYIAFLDDDDEWDPRHLESFRDLIGRLDKPNNALMYCPVQIRRQGSSSIRPARAKRAGESFLEYIVYGNGLIQNSSIVIQRDRFIEFEFNTFNRKHIDYDICMWAELQGMEFVMSPHCTAFWNCQGEQGRLSKSDPAKSQKWIQEWSQRTEIDGRLQAAFLAMHQAPLLFDHAPLQAVRLLLSAALRGYISFRVLARCLRAILHALHK